jgi:hypothetical protein
MYKRSQVQLAVDFSAESMETRRLWNDIVKELKMITKNLVSSKTVLQKWRLMKNKKFIANTSLEILNEILQDETNYMRVIWIHMKKAEGQ